jgi:hypothetical protein
MAMSELHGRDSRAGVRQAPMALSESQSNFSIRLCPFLKNLAKWIRPRDGAHSHHLPYAQHLLYMISKETFKGTSGSKTAGRAPSERWVRHASIDYFPLHQRIAFVVYPKGAPPCVRLSLTNRLATQPSISAPDFHEGNVHRRQFALPRGGVTTPVSTTKRGQPTILHCISEPSDGAEFEVTAHCSRDS